MNSLAVKYRVAQGRCQQIKGAASYRSEGRGCSTEILDKQEVVGGNPDQCSLSVEEIRYKSPRFGGFGSNSFEKVRVEDTDSTPNLTIKLDKGKGREGILSVTNPTEGPEAKLEFQIADVSGLDRKYFKDGAFGPESSGVGVAVNPEHPEDVYLFNDASEERWIISPWGVSTH